MYKENELKHIDPSSKFIKFIIKRMNNPNFRGLHIMQHSRTCVNQYNDILKCIYKIKKEDFINIPKGDEYDEIKKPNGFKLGDYPDYNKLINEVKQLPYTAKFSPMSVKKIMFVDLDRLGLIERWTVKKNGLYICSKTVRCSPNKVRISKYGIELLKEKNEFEKKYIVAKSFKKVFSDLIETLMFLFIECNIKKITIEEYTLIVSWVNFKNNDFTKEKCADIIKSFKMMSANSIASVMHFFQNNSKAKNSKKSNNKYWDWSNWKNETQTIFNILKNTHIFSFDKKSISLNNLNPKENYKRAKNVIMEYDKWHNINKKIYKNSGFEYHHIIPMAWINSQSDYMAVDNVKNILLISGNKHNIIPKRNNTFVKLSYIDNKLIISNYSTYNHKDREIVLIINKDVYLKKELISEIIKYNKQLLEKL